MPWHNGKPHQQVSEGGDKVSRLEVMPAIMARGRTCNRWELCCGWFNTSTRDRASSVLYGDCNAVGYPNQTDQQGRRVSMVNLNLQDMLGPVPESF